MSHQKCDCSHTIRHQQLVQLWVCCRVGWIMGEERIQGLTLDLVLQMLVHGCIQMNVKHQTLMTHIPMIQMKDLTWLTHILMMSMTNVSTGNGSTDLFFDKRCDEIQRVLPVYRY